MAQGNEAHTPLVRIAQAAAALGISRQQIDKDIRDGAKCYRNSGGGRLIDLDELRTWRQANRIDNSFGGGNGGKRGGGRPPKAGVRANQASASGNRPPRSKARESAQTRGGNPSRRRTVDLDATDGADRRLGKASAVTDPVGGISEPPGEGSIHAGTDDGDSSGSGSREPDLDREAEEDRTGFAAPDLDDEAAQEREAEDLWAAIAGEVLAEPELLGVSDWSDRYGFLIENRQPIKWDSARNPVVKPILDAVTEKHDDGTVIRKISVMAAERVGKTEAGLRIVGWMIDQDPGDGLIVWPNREIAKDKAAKTLIPSIERTPRLAARMTGRSRDRKSMSLVLDRCDLKIASAPPNRVVDANLEASGYRLVYIDEFDRCHPDTGDIVAGRGKTLPRFLQLQTGTPTYAGIGIDAQYRGNEAIRGSDERRLWVPCPHENCRSYHVREWKDIRWPGMFKYREGPRWVEDSRDPEADPDQVERLAWLRCPDCKQKIGAEFNLWQLARLQCLTKDEKVSKWSGTGDQFIAGTVSGPPRSGTHAGFKLGGLVSCIPETINPYGYVARGYVQARGNPSMHWRNRVLGEPEEIRGDGIEVATLAALATPVGVGGYRIGRPPEACIILIASVDVQKSGAFVEVMGYGEYGADAYLIACEYVDWPEGVESADLDRVLDRVYESEDGRRMRVALEALDEGDGNRTEEIHNRARRRRVQGRLSHTHKGVGLRGGAESMPQTWSTTYLDRLGDGQPDKRSPMRIRVASHYWKSAAMRRLRSKGGVEGEDGTLGAPVSRLHFPEDVPREYLRQLASERLVMEKVGGRLVPTWHVKQDTPNHYWDAHYCGLAVAEAMGVRRLTKTPPRRDSGSKPDPEPRATNPAMERAKELQERMRNRFRKL